MTTMTSTVDELLLELEQRERAITPPPAAQGRVWANISPELSTNVLARQDDGKLDSPRPPASRLLIMTSVLGFGLLAAAHAHPLHDATNVQSLALAPEDVPPLPAVQVHTPLLDTRVDPNLAQHMDPAPRANEPSNEPPRERGRRPSELQIIVGIEQALDDGLLERALELVHVHEREHAKGRFIEERIALDARIRCRRGDVERGQAQAAALFRRFPRTIHESSVRHDCGILSLVAQPQHD